jgi:transcriptional regulator with XRE-family HTH domain
LKKAKENPSSHKPSGHSRGDAPHFEAAQEKKSEDEKAPVETAQTIPALLEGYFKRHPKSNVSWLADQLGVHRTWVSRIYHGKFNPDPQLCQKLAEIMGEPVELLLKLAGHLPQNLSLAAESELSDPELVWHLRQIGQLAVEDQEILKVFLREEIALRQQRPNSGQVQAVSQRPLFARHFPASPFQPSGSSPTTAADDSRKEGEA